MKYPTDIPYDIPSSGAGVFAGLLVLLVIGWYCIKISHWIYKNVQNARLCQERQADELERIRRILERSPQNTLANWPEIK